MRLGYNTNGLAHHDLLDAVNLLADLGYRSVAITVDHGALSPRNARYREQLEALDQLLQRRKMYSVIETGARYLLNPRRKHEPTLVSADPAARAQRIEFYRHAVRCAAALGSDCVSIWSGKLHDQPPRREAFDRLLRGLEQTLQIAEQYNVTIAFEPEPGMLIDSMASWAELVAHFDSPRLGLTLDVGHLYCQGELPAEKHIAQWADRLVNVHLEDMRRGEHRHLMFGEGDVDFPAVIAALQSARYRGGVHVELSRHSHEGPSAARTAYEFLAPLMMKDTSAHE